MGSTLATSLEFSVFCNVSFVFCIILQIRVDNTQILVLNFIILEINTNLYYVTSPQCVPSLSSLFCVQYCNTRVHIQSIYV